MKRKVSFMLALMMCVAMVFGVVPADANAVALQGVQMPQQKQITFGDEWGWGYDAHYFTEFADLVEIVNVAAADPDNYYECCYNAGGDLVFISDLQIPANLSVWTGDAVIPAGVTLTIYGNFYPGDVQIQGNCVMAPGAWLSCGNVNVTGSLLVDDATIYTGFGSTITGQDKITFKQDARIHLQAWFDDEAELRQLLQTDFITDEYWRYEFEFVGKELHFTQPVTIPKPVDLGLNGEAAVISGAPITVLGGFNINIFEKDTIVKNDLILEEGAACGLYGFNTDNHIIFEGNVTANTRMNVQAPVIFKGNVTVNDYMMVYNHVTFDGAVKNNYAIQVAHYNKGALTFNRPDLYNDQIDGDWGAIFVVSEAQSLPPETYAGLVLENFQDFDYNPDEAWMPYWTLGNYKTGTSDPSVHEHTVVVDPAKAPTCLEPGLTEGAHCGTCGEVLVKQEVLAPLGHTYTDPWDTSCNVCGAVRNVDASHLTYSMYRMYDPNSGEHFYTGSMEERQMLESVGWKYEGVGFTFPYSSGKPVYRLYDKYGTFEHLYTMDEAEKDALLAQGWVYENIAFNSCPNEDVPQYRLHNPNATRGAYHFTASEEERDTLISLGWEYQGIGFYTCWQ